MSDQFAQSVYNYLLPTRSSFTYNPDQKQIITDYQALDQDIINFGILASQVGLDNVYYTYYPDYFMLYWTTNPSNSTQVDINVPSNVQEEARIGLLLHSLGYNGGTDTGYGRAKQLISGTMDIDTIRVMRNWFARHLYVSYNGYEKWVNDGKPQTYISGKKNSYRGAIAWLIWGGDSAYQWIKSSEIQNALNASYPNKDNSLP